MWHCNCLLARLKVPHCWILSPGSLWLHGSITLSAGVGVKMTANYIGFNLDRVGWGVISPQFLQNWAVVLLGFCSGTQWNTTLCPRPFKKFRQLHVPLVDLPTCAFQVPKLVKQEQWLRGLMFIFIGMARCFILATFITYMEEVCICGRPNCTCLKSEVP